ncbi:MAG: hypothetical protein JWS12_339 [Candidatus Saccharibacteria bacterium]|nr:hypothetical protein [Candidatus Saccharibacteria bacterium]
MKTHEGYFSADDRVDDLLAVKIGIFAGADDIPAENWSTDEAFNEELAQELLDIMEKRDQQDL